MLAAVRLLPDLRPGQRVVRLGVRHVRVLIRLVAAGDLLGEAVGDRVVALGRVVLDRGRRDHDLGAVRAQKRDLLLAHLVGHDEDAAVALDRGADREPDAGVAGGRLDDRPARLELPFALGRLDHRQADPVLHRAARVQVLELREHVRAARRRELRQADDRRRADELEDCRVVLRHRREAYATRGPPRPFARPPPRPSRPRRCGRARAPRRPRRRRCRRSPRTPSAKPLVCALSGSWPLASSVFACVKATVAAMATPSAPPICCDVLISPDASPAS